MAGVTIFDDVNDPYQMNVIDYKAEPELFQQLLDILKDKLQEADDIWFREQRLETLEF